MTLFAAAPVAAQPKPVNTVATKTHHGSCAKAQPRNPSATAAGLLAVEWQGRHRYHRLASPGVARMLEGIIAVAEVGQVLDRVRHPVVVGPCNLAMRAACTCYGPWLAGLPWQWRTRWWGKAIELSADGGTVTPDGSAFLMSLGLDLHATEDRAAKRGGRVFCRPCLDWSERRPHVAGAVGAALCDRCFTSNWVRRVEGPRAVMITPKGRHEIKRPLGVEAA